MRLRRATPALYLGPCLALYALFVLWPMLETCWLGLQRWNGYGPQTFIGLSNYSSLWSDSVFRTSLTHSALWELAAVTVPALLGLLLALLISRSRGRYLLLTVLFFPALLPATAVAAVWTLVYSPVSGLLNSLLRDAGMGGLAADWLGDPHLALGALFAAWAWSAVGVGTLLFWTGLSAIGRDYVDLALVEGAGPLQRLRHVTLPALRRTGFLVLIVNAALATQVFDLVYVTTGGGPGYATMILPLDAYGRAFGGQTGQGAAVATVQLLFGVLLVALALAVRHTGESFDLGEQREREGSSTLATVAGALLAAVLVLPLGWLALASLERGRAFALGQAAPGLDPRRWQWSNFSTVWNGGMSGSIETSLLLALVGVALTLLLAAPAAFALARMLRNPGWKILLLALFLAGLLQPTSVLIIPLFSLLKSLGLLDSVWGVLLPETARSLPFAILILWGFLTQSPGDVIEAAAVDGASALQQMLRVALPLARPALFAVAIWAFVTSWNEYLLPTVVSQDGSLQTVPTLLGTYIGKYDTQFGLLAAGCLLAMLPSLLIYVALRRPAGRGLGRVERGIE